MSSTAKVSDATDSQICQWVRGCRRRKVAAAARNQYQGDMTHDCTNCSPSLEGYDSLALGQR